MWLIVLNGILVVNLAVWGPVNETFRAKFVLLREELGEGPVMAKARSLMVVAGGFGACLVVGIVLLRYPIARLLAPAYDEQQLYALATMLVIVAPSLVIDQFNNFCISLLNAYHSFFIPEISNGIAALVNIIAMVLLAPHIGIYALAVSYYAGLGLMFLLVIREVFLRKIPLFRQLSDIRLLDFMPFFYYALPFFVPYFFIQVNLLIEKSLGNILGEGIVSILDYARKFVDIPINVLTSVMLTILVPMLSKHYGKKDVASFLYDFRQIFQLGFLAVSLLIAFFTSSSLELISVIMYQGQQLSLTTISAISDLSVYYSWTAYVNFFYIIFGLALLSTNRGSVYAFWGTAAQLVMIVMNLVLYRKWGVSVFPFSFIVAHMMSAVALFLAFPFAKRSIVLVSLRYSAVLVLLVTISFFLNGRLIGLINSFWILTFNGGVICLSLVAFLFLFKLEERLVLTRSMAKVFGVLGREKRRL